MNSVCEERFVNAFVEPRVRDRYRSLLLSTRRRKDLLNGWNHNAKFAPKFISNMAPAHATDQRTALRAVMASATELYVIVDGSDHDGTFVSSEQAIELLMGHSWATLCIVDPDKLAIFRQESPAPIQVLKRTGRG